MKNYDKKQALSIILKTAAKYDEKLKDKHFLIVYRNKNEICTCCVGFRDMNYLHLTGVKTKLSAQQFYSACLSGKLSIKDFDIDKKGKVQQKLAVLPFLPGMLYHNCMIGNFINSGIVIKADYFVGDTKAVLSVGFRYGKTADIPVTLYNENVKKLSYPTCKVLAIFVKSYQAERYVECTYLSKEYEIGRFPDIIKQKLEENAIYHLRQKKNRKDNRKMELTVKKFDELTTTELYEILKARAEIFIKEQQINYQDMDDFDYRSLHCFFKEGDKVIAYLRAFYKDEEQTVVKVGRVLTLTHGTGLGRRLLEESLAAIKKQMECKKITVDAQKYAEGFYVKFGFQTISGEYMEEGIVHVDMELEVR